MLSDEERTRLLVAAGRTIHPDPDCKRRLVRSLRSAQRRRAEAHDRSLLASTGIRAAREVRKPRTCYVRKAELRPTRVEPPVGKSRRGDS